MFEELLAVLFRPITQRLEALVATVEELNAKLEALKTALAEAKERITEDVAELRRLIDGAVDPADLDPIVAQLDALTESVGAIDPEPAYPPEEETEGNGNA